MPTKEIKELRQSGKLDEALAMAKAELQADPENIWTKRNLSWVHYDFLKQHISPTHYNEFISHLLAIKELALPTEEKMLYDQLGWQIGKMVFGLIKTEPIDIYKCIQLWETVQSFHFSKPGEGYSFLFKAFHKALKEHDIYIKFADWWDFKNFMPNDFVKEHMPNGRDVMAIAEQAYIAYAKHVLPKQNHPEEVRFDKEKAKNFIPILTEIADKYPNFQYPNYFVAKLHLATGDKDNMLSSLIPFAKKKRNDFWVWDILAEAFSNDLDTVFACYCKALSCHSPEEMLVNLRQKMAKMLISRNLYNEARFEIERLVETRNLHDYKLPNEVKQWQAEEWYKNANQLKSNAALYKAHSQRADELLFRDTPQTPVIVEFVNDDKQILNFITAESKFGFFKYDRFLKKVNIGDTLHVRFQGGCKDGMNQVFTVLKVEDDDLKKQFLRSVEGEVKIAPGKSFGFLGDVYIHPSIVKKMKLFDGMLIKGLAIRSFNPDKKTWGWKLTETNEKQASQQKNAVAQTNEVPLEDGKNVIVQSNLEFGSLYAEDTELKKKNVTGTSSSRVTNTKSTPSKQKDDAEDAEIKFEVVEDEFPEELALEIVEFYNRKFAELSEGSNKVMVAKMQATKATVEAFKDKVPKDVEFDGITVKHLIGALKSTPS